MKARSDADVRLIQLVAARARGLRRLLIVGLVLCAAPLLGLLATLAGMLEAFHTISESQNPSPEELAPGIELAAGSTLAGLLIALLGAALVIYALIGLSRVARIERELETDAVEAE